MLANVADRIFHLHVFGRAEVEDFDVVFGFQRQSRVHHMEHRGEAVLHVEIGFPLRAVTEHFEMVGMVEELFVEIKNVPVGVAFAENGDEAKHVALELETFAIRVNQALACDLRRGVERSLNRKRRVLRRGNNFRLAIHRAGRGKRDALDAIGAHRFEDVEGGDGVLLQIFSGMIEAETHVGVGGEMKDGVAAGHRFRERR